MGETGSGLLPGERVLWTGRPAQGRVIPRDLVWPGLLLVALAVSLVVYGLGGPVRGPGSLGFEALSMGAGLAGAVALLVRGLRVNPDELRQTTYQVTDRRVLITTGPRRTWAAYLDQLAEPVLVPQRDGTADLTLREKKAFSLTALTTSRQALPLAFLPGAQGRFPVLRSLPDAEAARQAISDGRMRMLRGQLDVPPVRALPATDQHPGFVPWAGEQVLWTGRPQAVPWWFGSADIAFSAYFAVLVLGVGFMIQWARSTHAPPLLLPIFATFAVCAFGYPAVGRLLARRSRIRRSVYILTSSRLITTWAAGRRPGGTQAPLAQLLPPQVKDGSVVMNLAWPSSGTDRSTWAQQMWPAASTDPPQLIGMPDPQAVADLICSAQLAERARSWQLTKPGTRGNGSPSDLPG